MELGFERWVDGSYSEKLVEKNFHDEGTAWARKGESPEGVISLPTAKWHYILVLMLFLWQPMTLPMLEAPNIREMMESFPGREFLKSPDKLFNL